MECPSCGYKNNKTDKNCIICGASINTVNPRVRKKKGIYGKGLIVILILSILVGINSTKIITSIVNNTYIKVVDITDCHEYYEKEYCKPVAEFHFYEKKWKMTNLDYEEKAEIKNVDYKDIIEELKDSDVRRGVSFASMLVAFILLLIIYNPIMFIIYIIKSIANAIRSTSNSKF